MTQGKNIYRKPAEPKILIFDFDGTLADTFALSVDIFYALRPGVPLLPKQEVDRLRGLAMGEVVRELRIRWWELPILLFRGKRQMTKRIREVALIFGMEEVVRELHRRGHTLCVLSSNSRENIVQVLKDHDLLDYFDDIQGNARLHGKARMLRKITLRHPGQAVYYIGDEVRDVRAAQHAGVRSVAVTWGYNNIHVLDTSKPDFLVLDPDTLLEIFD